MNTDYQPVQEYDGVKSSEIEKKARAILNSPRAKASLMTSLALQFCQPSSPQPVSRPYFPSKGTLIF